MVEALYRDPLLPHAVPPLFQLSPFRAKATFRVTLRVDSRKQSPIWGLRWPSSRNPWPLQVASWELEKGAAGEGGRASRWSLPESVAQLRVWRGRSTPRQASEAEPRPKGPPPTPAIKTQRLHVHNVGFIFGLCFKDVTSNLDVSLPSSFFFFPR